MDEAAVSSITRKNSNTLFRILNGNIDPIKTLSDGSMRADKSPDALARTTLACIVPVDL
jgi:hypothetical protein